MVAGLAKIEELLESGEVITKKKGGVAVGGTAYGTLYLTNRRLMWIKSGWQIFPGELFLERGKAIQIPLDAITRVEKGLATLKVHADREYRFGVTVFAAGDWRKAVDEATKK